MNPTLSKWLFYVPVTRLRGEKVLSRLRELERTQWASEDQLQALVRKRLRTILDHARKTTAYYRDTLASCPGGALDESTLASLPTVSKQDVVDHAADMRAGATGPIEAKTTGGSTGRAVTIYKDREALGWERAATWRGYGWAGLPVASPQARFWGVPTSARARRLSRLTDIVANRVRFSAFGVTEAELESYYRTLLRFEPLFLYGYVSFISAFSDYMASLNYRLPGRVRAVICTSEVLSAESRAKLQGQLGVPVYNEYGCGEVGSIAHECGHRTLHINSETLHVEIDSPGDDQPGELIVTDLFNRAMPLIRYRLGDYGVWQLEPCPCGRRLPALSRIVGRAYDMVQDAAGQWHHPEAVMYVFEDIKKRGARVDGFQVIQRQAGDFRVKLITSSEELSTVSDMISVGLKAHFGREIDVAIETVGEIPREASGKLRLIKREAF